MATSATNKPKKKVGATKPGPSRKQNVFETLLKNANAAGITPQKQKESIEWFRSKASKTKESQKTVMNALSNRHKQNAKIGSMYFYSYDPKTKDELPYYDVFPLVIPIEPKSDGFIGINFHYLPPMIRAKLLDALFELVNNDRYDNTTKLNISYQILKSASKYKYFKPALKRYLTTHLRSSLLYVEPSEWAIACFLPVSQFRYGNEQKVYRDSLKKIG